MFLEGNPRCPRKPSSTSMLKPVITGRTFCRIQPLDERPGAVAPPQPPAQFAIEEALLDLKAKQLNTPLFNLLRRAVFCRDAVMRALTLKIRGYGKDAVAYKEKGYTHMS